MPHYEWDDLRNKELVSFLIPVTNSLTILKVKKQQEGIQWHFSFISLIIQILETFKSKLYGWLSCFLRVKIVTVCSFLPVFMIIYNLVVTCQNFRKIKGYSFGSCMLKFLKHNILWISNCYLYKREDYRRLISPV